jgi:hypothetical protein
MARRLDGRLSNEKKGIHGGRALAGAVFTAGTAHQALKNKEPRMVPIKLEKELTLGERAEGQEALFQSIPIVSASREA